MLVDNLQNLQPLAANLRTTFSDETLLDMALTHRSYLNESIDTSLHDNERLEFLGDAVLDFVVAAYLYENLPDLDEGELTALRAALVRAETLAGFAQALDVGHYLRLGYGEAESGGRERTAILCAAFEAVVGAIYLDQGLDAVQALVDRMVPPALDHIRAGSLHKDAKSEFQVWAQARYNTTPHYRMVASEGPDHAKNFTVQAIVGQEVWGEGNGHSKQSAAQAAAAEALIKAAARDAV